MRLCGFRFPFFGCWIFIVTSLGGSFIDQSNRLCETGHVDWWKMACIATWSFGVEAVLAAAKEIEREGNCLDAVEKSVNGERKK